MQADHQVSRRAMVRGAAGVAAVSAVAIASAGTAHAKVAAESGAGAAGALPSQADRAGHVDHADHALPEETIVVHVRDARTGRLDLYVGDRHIEVNDRDLASRLVKAAR